MEKYSKIIHTAGRPPIDLITDIRYRAGHYAREAQIIARRNIFIDKALTIATFIISAAVTTVLMLYQTAKLTGDFVVWTTVAGSACISLISIFQHFSFDSFVSNKTLATSQRFHELKEEAKMLLSLCEIEEFSEKTILTKYNAILNKYNKLREDYVQYAYSHRLYYGFSRSPGEIRKDI